MTQLVGKTKARTRKKLKRQQLALEKKLMEKYGITDVNDPDFLSMKREVSDLPTNVERVEYLEQMLEME